MKKSSFILVWISLLFVAVPVRSAQSHHSQLLLFQQYSLKEGLSQSTVFDIVQDKLGYMWFATTDGLNRFDGYKFTVFRHESEDSLSLFSNSINSLMIDLKGYVWVGALGGIAKYDNAKNKFENYIYRNKGEKIRVFRIVEWSSNSLFLATNLGLFHFSPQKGFRKLFLPSLKSVNALCRIDNKILVGGSNGLFIYEPSSGQSYQIPEVLTGKQILTLLPESGHKKRIWIGTEGDGLFLYDMVNDQVKVYKHDQNNPNSISSNFVRSLCYDNNYRLWVGTFVGLNIYNDIKDEFIHYYNNINEEGSLSQNSIRSIYKDNEGGIWFGTFYGGVNYYHPLRSQFEHIHYIRGVNSLSDNVVSCMLVDSSDKIWIGTNDKGLNLYDPHTKLFRYFQAEEMNPAALSGNNVKSLLLDKKGNLYIGTHDGGLNRMNMNTKVLQHIPVKDKSGGAINVYSLIEDNQGCIWVGTLNGIILYWPDTNKSLPLDDVIPSAKNIDKRIMSLFKDSYGKIWIGTENGLAVFSSQTKKIEFVRIQGNGNINKSIYCFYEDKFRRIWIGSNEGLYLYDRKLNKLISQKEKTGLPDYSFYGIQEDKLSRLWVSSNRGLLCFSPNQGTWRLFTESDGMQSNQFNMYSYCLTSDNRMYFGGINGITAFYPDQLIDNPYTPSVIIDNLTIFNKSIFPGDETGVLTENINVTKKIRLKAGYAQFGLEFVVPNYLAGHNNRFAYMLEGFDDTWYYTDRGSVSYSNLRPGKYLFKVKAANNDRRWSDKVTVLEIIVLPKWWETWWARFIFILIVGGIGIYIFRFYVARQLMRRELALERIEKEKNKEINEMKIRFFINISHEFRTPLTLILSPLQEIMQRGVEDKWVKEQLDHTLRNARRMLHLVNQVLDFRKVEQGAMELKVSKAGITDFAYSVYDMFSKMAVRKKINYLFESMLEDRLVWFDANYLERIMSNLISNAFKHTPEGGFVEVKLSENMSMLVLEVSDTGSGIPKEKQAFIFDEFYQIDENTKGTGIGLSLVKRLVELYHGKIELCSEEGKGATFIVKLPMKENVFDENEKQLTIIDAPLNRFQSQKGEELIDLLVSSEAVSEVENNKDDQNRKTILLVEDDVEVRQYLVSNFNQYFNVISMENGEKAWLYLGKNTEVDLIISDVMMPVMDGMKLCKLVKHNVRTCHIPLILLTAKTDATDQLAGLSVGADDYLGKPFIFSILYAKVLNLFKARERLLQYYSSSIDFEPDKVAFNAMDEELLRKAKEIVEKNVENSEFSAEDFSREMGMSRSNLHLKLKALTGESAIEFIRRIRFSQASKLLKDGRYNIAEISTMVGYNTPSYFTTSFKKYFGCLPTEYVKK